jgi:hypothetical protein
MPAHHWGTKRTEGPASENLQGTKPRESGRGFAVRLQLWGFQNSGWDFAGERSRHFDEGWSSKTRESCLDDGTMTKRWEWMSELRRERVVRPSTTVSSWTTSKIVMLT